MNAVLFVFKAADTIPVHPGKILTLFFATSGMEICCMYNLLEAQSCQADRCVEEALPIRMS